jgi:hypothetical protein
MRQNLMIKFWCFLFFTISFSALPIFAQNQVLRFNTSFASNSANFLGLQNGLRSSSKGIAKLDIKYDTNSSSSQLALNYDEYDNFTLDRTYFQYTSGLATFGVGAIDRHWSFSKKTSLILSHNARPFKSIYLKLNNRFKYNWMPSKANWSFEVFNGRTNDSLNMDEAMLLGARVILSPIEGLDFELLQTSQWGGNGFNSGKSALGAALLFDTNDSSNSNINKMAGFGISYLIPIKQMPLRIYGQAIGEDEAGNLPSCYSYLAGLEWSNTQNRYPLSVGFETVDTRIDKTSHGYCGPNTMYNNGTYDYINYADTMGAEIDTEGKSLEFFGQSQISQKINIKYSTKLVTINDNNWTGHRLSSKRETGHINSLGVSWNTGTINLDGTIYHQDLNLDKENIKSGYGVSISSSIKF